MCRDGAPVGAHSVPLGCNSNVSRKVLVANVDPPQKLATPKSPRIQSARSTNDAQASNSKRQPHSLSRVLPFGKQFVAKMQHRPESALGRGEGGEQETAGFPWPPQPPARALAVVLFGRQPPCGLGGTPIQSVDICRHAVILTSMRRQQTNVAAEGDGV